jgi:hypothetical protein
MEDLIYLWIRLSRALAAGVKAAAKESADAGRSMEGSSADGLK